MLDFRKSRGWVTGGLFRDYAIHQNENGTVTVIDNKPELWGDEGVDLLTGMEKLQFADRTVYLDGSGDNRPITERWDWAETFRDTGVLVTTSELLACSTIPPQKHQNWRVLKSLFAR